MLMKFIQIIVILLLVHNSHELDIECKFKDIRTLYDEASDYITIDDKVLEENSHIYFCEVKKIWDDEEQRVKFVNGSHLEGRSEKNVMSIIFKDLENLNYIPKNLLQFFPNLISISSYNTNLSRISSSDLESYSELKFFTLMNSKISYLPSDLFKFNTKLESILISENGYLDHVGKKLLENLKYLKKADFNGNQCIHFYADTPEQIEELKRELATDECTPYVREVFVEAFNGTLMLTREMYREYFGDKD